MFVTKLSGYHMLLLACSLVVPSQEAGPNLNQGQVEVIEKHAMVVSASVWPEGSRIIHVCWENPELATAQEKGVVQQAVSNTWQKYSALKFVWSEKCERVTAGLRIAIEDRADLGPHTNCADGDPTRCLGSYLDGISPGIVLNFSYEKWSPTCKDKKDYCDYAIAVHEFGHAIGFAHEQNRPDAPGECQRRAQGPNGDYPLTSYDRDSVMNYCNAKWNNDGNLSEWDKKALHQLYATP